MPLTGAGSISAPNAFGMGRHDYKMVKLGAQGTDEEFEAILGYLSKNFDREQPGQLTSTQQKR